jgi:ABC-2 type transport system permease protein
MWLGLRRDRPALALAVLLPVVFFFVFAAIFAGALGENTRPRLALADEVDSPVTRRLVAALRADTRLLLLPTEPSRASLRARVRAGQADAGLVLRGDAQALGVLGGLGPAPLLLLVDPAKAPLAQVTAGLVQDAYWRALPDVALGGVARFLDDQYLELDERQRQALDEGLAELRGRAPESGARPAAFGELLEHERVAGPPTARNHVAYSAGAVAILFLFFSALHGALAFADERTQGILERLVSAPAGLRPLVDGRFLFLVAQGCLQVSLIFVLAWLAYGVELPRHLVGCALVSLAAAAAAAGCALALVGACRTRQQAQTLANVAILISSALGGCMVPRFFMPAWIQALGWATPQTWALEAYTRLFWRDQPLLDLATPLALLLACGLGGLLLARRLAARSERL